MPSLRLRAAAFPIVLLVLVLTVADVVISTIDPPIVPSAIYVSAALLLLLSALSLWYAKRLIQPISELMPTVDAKGHLEFRSTTVAVTPPEELRAITKAIDQIAEKQRRDDAA